MRTSLDVFEGGFVGSNHAGAGARFNRHVADRHAAFHRQLADCLASIFQNVALTTAGADLCDDSEDDIFRSRPCRQGTVDGDCHGLERSQWQGLGCQNVFDLAGTDTECECAECTVRRGMRVTADNRHTWLSDTQLRADNMNDALVGITQRVQTNTELFSVRTQSVNLGTAGLVSDRQVDIEGRGVVILGGDRLIGTTNLSPCHAQPFESLGTGHFVNKVEVNVKKVRGATFALFHNMVLPDLFGHRAGHVSSLRAFKIVLNSAYLQANGHRAAYSLAVSLFIVCCFSMRRVAVSLVEMANF